MILEAVNGLMDGLGIPYMYWEFEYDGDLPDLYFVGENIESPAMQEDGMQAGDFILSGWSRSGPQPLIDAKRAIRRKTGGMPLVVNGDGGSVAIEYSHAIGVPSDVEGVCRLEIHINYHEWSE